MMKPTGTDDQPYEIDEFSGGITDYYIDGPKNAAQYMENLLLTENRKLTTRPGITYLVDSQVNSSATRTHVFNHLEEPLVFQGRHAFYKANATTWTKIYGPNAGGATDPAISNTGAGSSSILSTATWKGQTFVTTDDPGIPDKIYKNSSGTWKVRTAGLPEPASLSGVSSSVGTTKSYIYAVVFKYEYEVGNETFQDRSAPTYATVQSLNAVGSATITLTLPTFTGFGLNWDAVNISQEIYRTVDGGQDLFLVATEVYNDTSYADTMTDATLVDQDSLYTNGGIIASDAPPKCKYVHISGDIGYFGYLEDSSGVYPSQVRQSIPGDIDSVPGDFNIDVREAVKGISSHNGRVMILCEKEILRVEGSYNIYGQGSPIAASISPDAGCISNNSIVQTPYGIFWFGNEGIYTTEGYAVTKISQHITETYKTITNSTNRKIRVRGIYNSEIQCVMWTVSRDDVSECDAILILDLRFGVRSGALDVKQTPATFYFWSGHTFSGIAWVDRQLLLSSSDGYVYEADSTETQDIKFAATGTPSDWEPKVILYQWTSTATDFGIKFYRKWVTWFMFAVTSISNISLGIKSIVDDGKIVAELKPIRHRSNIVWGVTPVFWGAEGYLWNKSGTLDFRRRVPSRSLRSMHRQVQIENAKVVVLGSETMGTVVVNSGSKTATLSGTLSWPSQFVDYFISFENDDYVREFSVSTVSTNTLVFADSGNYAPATGSYNFIVRGYPKGETLSLNAIQMWWQPISKTQRAFATSQTGEP